MTTTKKEKMIRVPFTKDTYVVEYVSREAFDVQMVDMSNALENRMEHVDDCFEKQAQEIADRTQYQGWLVSPDIKKRSVAVFGHALLAYLVFASITVITLMLLDL